MDAVLVFLGVIVTAGLGYLGVRHVNSGKITNATAGDLLAEGQSIRQDLAVDNKELRVERNEMRSMIGDLNKIITKLEKQRILDAETITQLKNIVKSLENKLKELEAEDE